MLLTRITDKYLLFPLILFILIFATYIWKETAIDSFTMSTVVLQAPQYPELVPYYKEIEQLVEEEADVSEIIPPFYPMENFYVVSPPYNLATCEIEKNMLTIRRSIFCYLTNTTQFIAENRSISTEFWNDWLCDRTFIRNSLSSVRDTIEANLTLFTVVRHPIDRFLSGYVDKCMNELTYYTEDERCFGCRNDMRCFVDVLHEVFMEFYNNSTETEDDPEMARMDHYYIRHFAPQTWYCEFKEHRNEYIVLNYHTGPNSTRLIAEDFYKVFESAHVPKKHLETIYSEMMKGTTRHSTVKSSARKSAQQQLLSDGYVMRRLMQMFYYDFVEFGFF
ncbi:hypothetical protein V3C99_011389 [Haemonchus contortus]